MFAFRSYKSLLKVICSRYVGSHSRLTAYRIRINSGLQITGFSVGIMGIYFASCSGGLNFRISPKFSSEGSLQENMKAMIISLMMNEKLSEDEISILTNSVETICNMDRPTGNDKSSRNSWCITEIKNFMDCSTKYADFKTDRCKSYRMMLKSCLQAKKDGLSLEDPGLRYKAPPCFKNKSCAIKPDEIDESSSKAKCDSSETAESNPVTNPKSIETIKTDCTNKAEGRSFWNAYCDKNNSDKQFRDASTSTEC